MLIADITLAYTLLRRYEEARDACVVGLKTSGAPTEVQMRLTEGFLSALMAEALERYQTGEGDGAIGVLEDLRRITVSLALSVSDASVRDRIQHVEQLAKLCVPRCVDPYVRKVGDDLVSLIEEWLAPFRTSEQERFFGTIIKLVQEKGFAFIKPLEAGNDLFLHRSQVMPNEDWSRLREGSEVSFSRVERKGKPQAVRVWLLS